MGTGSEVERIPEGKERQEGWRVKEGLRTRWAVEEKKETGRIFGCTKDSGKLWRSLIDANVMIRQRWDRGAPVQRGKWTVGKKEGRERAGGQCSWEDGASDQGNGYADGLMRAGVKEIKR